MIKHYPPSHWIIGDPVVCVVIQREDGWRVIVEDAVFKLNFTGAWKLATKLLQK